MTIENWEVYSGVTKAEGNGQGTLQSFLFHQDMLSLKVAFLFFFFFSENTFHNIFPKRQDFSGWNRPCTVTLNKTYFTFLPGYR